MAVGQEVLVGGWDVPDLAVLEERLSGHERARSALHADLLADAARLEELLTGTGGAVGVGAHLALLLGCSDSRAEMLLEHARVLAALPAGLTALGQGVLTVEQVGVFVTETGPLDPTGRALVWQRLLTRLHSAAEQGAVLPPARLRQQLRRWAISIDPAAAVRRRERAQADGRVEYRRRDDGLVDLFAFGITGPNARACLSSLTARSAPLGPDDTRTADRRRLDALVDLLTGRDTLFTPTTCARRTPVVDRLAREDLPGGAAGDPAGDVAGDPAGGITGAGAAGPDRADAPCPGRRRAPCGCGLAAAVPCGAQVQVLVPLGAALGVTDELAELVGHGPLDPDLLRQLLHTSPVLRAVWIDQHGIPVAVADTTSRPRRHDPVDLRRALLTLAATPPPPPDQHHPRHPHDHPPRPGSTSTGPAGQHRRDPGTSADSDGDGDGAQGFEAGADPAASLPAGGRPAADTTHPGAPGPAADSPGTLGAAPRQVDQHSAASGAHPTGAASGAHPTGTPGAHPAATPGLYRPGRRLRRLLTVRRPLCEWPGCGVQATRCDLDHDLAWPTGPTCACNLGPLCRRHHRTKQTGWTKTRTPHAVHWTSPTGRTWTSPTPHQPPAPQTRPLGPVLVPHPLDLLSPTELEQELWNLAPDSPLFHDTTPSTFCDDVDPDDPNNHRDRDRQGDRIRRGDTRWTLDLADTQAWEPHPT